MVCQMIYTADHPFFDVLMTADLDGVTAAIQNHFYQLRLGECT